MLESPEEKNEMELLATLACRTEPQCQEREREGWGNLLLRVILRPVCPACPREAELLEIPSVEEVTVPPSPAPSPPPPGLPEIWGRWDGRLARRLCRADTGM